MPFIIYFWHWNFPFFFPFFFPFRLAVTAFHLSLSISIDFPAFHFHSQLRLAIFFFSLQLTFPYPARNFHFSFTFNEQFPFLLSIGTLFYFLGITKACPSQYPFVPCHFVYIALSFVLYSSFRPFLIRYSTVLVVPSSFLRTNLYPWFPLFCLMKTLGRLSTQPTSGSTWEAERSSNLLIVFNV